MAMRRSGRPFSWIRLKNKLRAAACNPFNVMVLVALAVLFVTVVIPLVMLIANSFTLAPRDVKQLSKIRPGVQAGSFTTWCSYRT